MKKLFFIIWFPHSGCRWLNRSMLSNNDQIKSSEFVLPFLTHSTDQILQLDKTSQVHKARSSSELQHEFNMLKKSTEEGRICAIQHYLNTKYETHYEENSIVGGPISPGAPHPQKPDLDSLLNSKFDVYFIHLIRNPVDCFLSMKSRSEMDGDAYEIASLWTSFNCYVRTKLNGSNYLQVRYEDLKSNTKNELVRICDFLKVNFQEEMLKTDNYFGKNKNKELNISNEDKELIKYMCLNEYSQYYDSEEFF